MEKMPFLLMNIGSDEPIQLLTHIGLFSVAEH